MISYDTYQNKIKRVAAVKNFIVRFRALFITFFAAIIALILTFIFIKGMIIQDVILPDKIVYGDNYLSQIQAPKALFSDAQYQFKRVKEKHGKSSVKYAVADSDEEGYDWTYDIPTLAGKYLVRTVTKKTFGKSYGDPKEFEIETYPVDFVITGDSIVYGEIPDSGSYEFNLINGDRLVTEGLKIDYKNPELELTEICANSDSFVILNKSGEDVTFCYDIKVEPKEVTIAPRDITIAPESLTVEYNGAEIDYKNALSESSILNLKGDTAQIKTEIYDAAGNLLDGAPVNAGTYTVKIIQDETKIFNGEADVLKHYNIKYSTAKIEITKRSVIVTTADDKKEYDGTSLVNSKITYDGLVDGHNPFETYVGEAAVNAGTYKNRYTCTVSDSNGEDITDNYQINYVYGTLEVTRRTISVTTGDHSKIYDGVALSECDYNTYTVKKDGDTPLIDGHTQSLVSWQSIFNVSESDTTNEIKIAVFDSFGTDVSANYDIKYFYGTLEIKQREICVTSATDEWVYDGKAHSNLTIKNITLADEHVSGNPVADGEEIIVNESESTSVTYYTKEAVENKIVCRVIKYGYYDTTANYKINYVNNGSLEIRQREICISSATDIFEYDGAEHTNTTISNVVLADESVEGNPVADGEEIIVIECTKVLNYTKEAVENVIVCKILKDGYDTTANYKINYVDNGTLKVEKRQITITTATLEKVYGKPLYGEATMNDGSDVFKIISGIEVDRLAQNHTYEPVIDSVVTVTDACTDIPNTTKYKIGYYDESKNFVDLTENYNINPVYGTLTVKQRKVMVNTATLPIKEYDGNALTSSAEGYEVSPIDNVEWFDLFDNHKLVVDENISVSITDVGTEDNLVKFKVFCDEDDVSENYQLSYTYGKLIIIPRTISVVTADGEWTYNGGAFSAPQATAVYGIVFDEELDYVVYEESETDEVKPFVLDHKLSLIPETECFVTDAGTYKNYCRYDIVDENEKSVISNYTVIMVYGTLNVKPRPLIITTADGDRVYDDTPYENISAIPEEYDEENESGIVKGHSIKYDTTQFTASVTYVTEGKIENELHYLVFDALNNDVTANYDIDNFYDYGEIYVTKRPVSVTTATRSFEFDGNKHSDPSWTITEGSLADGYSFTVVSQSYVQFVTDGEVENRVVYGVYTMADDDNGIIQLKDLTDNYDISYTYGKISCTARYIQVTTNSHNWTYDGEEHSDTGYEDAHIKLQLDADGEIIDYVIDEEAEGLVLGHQLVAQEGYSTITDYSEIDNNVEYIVENDEINKNYCIFKVVAGKLSISKRPLTITTASGSRVYNDEPFSLISATAEEFDKENKSGIVDGHTIVHDKTQFTASVTFVTEGNVTNELHYLVFDAQNKDVTDNYDIDNYYDYGEIYVTKRPLTIKTGSDSKKYDGTPLVCADYELEPLTATENEGLLSDEKHKHKIVLDDSYIPSITYIRIKDGLGEEINSTLNDRRYFVYSDDNTDLSANYELTVNPGTLTITKRPLTITTPTLSWKYDGTRHDAKEVFETENGKPKFDNLVEGESPLGCVAYTWIIDYVEGGVENKVVYSLYNAQTQYTYFCYDITYVYGRLYIEKVDLEITTSSPTKVYDGTPLMGDVDYDGKPTFVGIIEGETYKSYNIIGRTECGTALNTTKYSIYAERDGKKTETTRNYNINYIEGTLTVTERTVKIKTLDVWYEYDGTEHTSVLWDYAETTEYRLVEWHYLAVATIDSKITDVKYENGKIVGVENKVSYKVFSSGGNVSSNYKLEYEYGTLTVTPRNILVTTASNSWTYDAEEHIWAKYENVVHTTDGIADEESALIDNHKLVPIADTATVVVGYVVDKDNEVNFSVKCGDNLENDVSGNYNISYEWGKLNIFKRKVTITTESEEHEYDGNALTCKDFGYSKPDTDSTQGLLIGKNHTAEIDESKSIASITYIKLTDDSKFIDHVSNVFTCIIKDANGKDISDNYNIIYEYGTLTILRRTLTITTASHSWNYDGQYHYGDDEQDGNETVFKDLVTGEFAVAVNPAKIIDYSDNGVDNNTKYQFYTDSSKETETTYCYYVNYKDNGKLWIEKINLVITTLTASKEYDGTSLRGDDEEYGTPAFEGIIDGDTYKSIENAVAQITDCGDVSNTTRYKIYRGETETTQNYNISYTDDGTLTVTVREITVATATDSREFDGTPFKNIEDVKVTYNSLAEGQELYVKDGATVASIIFVGSVENEIDYSIKDKNGVDVTENYAITYFVNGSKYGTLTITPRQISLTTADHEWVYDGGEKFDSGHSEPTHSSGKSALVLDHYLKPTKYANIYEAGEKVNVVEYQVLDADEDVSANYDITVNYGTLTVKPVELTILLNTIANFTYCNAFGTYSADGEMFKYLSGETVNGETLEIAIKYQLNSEDIEEQYPVNAGTYTIVVDWNNSHIVNGYENLDNYDITVSETSFTIAKREITIELLDAGSKIYDALAYEFPVDLNEGYKLADGSSLALGDTLTIAVKYLYETESGLIYVKAPVDAGSYIIEFDADNCIINDDYFAQENYIINCVNTATENVINYVIDKRPINYSINDVTHVYVGELSYSFDDDFDESQLLENDNLTVLAITVQEDGEYVLAVDVGEYDFVISNYTVLHKENEDDDDADGIDVTHNYELITPDTTAKLTIIPREIDVKVWFKDTLSDYSSREYSGDEINLKTEFPDYGPYTSTSDVATEKAPWGIYSGDLKKINAIFSSDVELVELGVYQISVTIKNADGTEDKDGVLKNYVINSYTDGTFEITKRQVNVTPKMTATQLAYSGEKVKDVGNLWFDYDTSHNRFPEEAGFLDADDKNDYDAVYSLYSVYDDSIVSPDSILLAGDYYLKVKLTYIVEDKSKEKYRIDDEFKSDIFTVNKRKIYANTPDDNTPYVYNKKAAATPASYTVYYYDGVNWAEGGFVNGDEEFATPVYSYHKQSGAYDSAVDAGEYTIRISSFEGENREVVINDNYEIGDFNDYFGNDVPEYGKLTIKPAILIVIPKSHQELYTGEPILTLPTDSYEIKYVEENGCELFGNSEAEKPVTLNFVASGNVNVYNMFFNLVTFTDVKISEAGKDITYNYDLIYTYDALNAMSAEWKESHAALVEELTPDKFSAELSFIQRKVYIEQFAPPESYKEIEFGTCVDIILENNVIPKNKIANLGDGLLTDHEVSISIAMAIGFELGYSKDWILMCKVTDKNNYDVSMGYEIIIVNYDETDPDKYVDTYITVTQKKITISVNRALASFNEGDKIDSELYNVQGSFVFGETLEVSVKGGEFVADIKLSGDDENDYNKYYDVKFVYPDMGNNEKEAEYASWI